MMRVALGWRRRVRVQGMLGTARNPHGAAGRIAATAQENGGRCPILRPAHKTEAAGLLTPACTPSCVLAGWRPQRCSPAGQRGKIKNLEHLTSPAVSSCPKGSAAGAASTPTPLDAAAAAAAAWASAGSTPAPAAVGATASASSVLNCERSFGAITAVGEGGGSTDIASMGDCSAAGAAGFPWLVPAVLPGTPNHDPLACITASIPRHIQPPPSPTACNATQS